MRASGRFFLFNKMLALTTYLMSSTEGDTICEIAGGEARTTRVLVRLRDHRITTGPNFDLVADIGLTDKAGNPHSGSIGNDASLRSASWHLCAGPSEDMHG